MSEKKEQLSAADLDAAKLAAMRLRFRRAVSGEPVSPSAIKAAKKAVADCVRSLQTLQNNEVKNA